MVSSRTNKNAECMCKRRVSWRATITEIIAILTSRYRPSYVYPDKGCTLSGKWRGKMSRTDKLQGVARKTIVIMFVYLTTWQAVTQNWTWDGSVHGSGRVGSGRFSLLSGSGRVQLCGSVWVTLDDTECFAKFSELSVLLMTEFRCTLGLHRKFWLSLNFLRRFLIFCTN